MGSKKKYLNIYYMFLLVVLFVMSLGLFSSCYAITSTELDNFFNYVDDQAVNITGYSHYHNWWDTNKVTYSENVINYLDTHYPQGVKNVVVQFMYFNYNYISRIRYCVANLGNVASIDLYYVYRYDNLNNKYKVDTAYNGSYNGAFINIPSSFQGSASSSDAIFVQSSSTIYGIYTLYPIEPIYTDYQQTDTITLQEVIQNMQISYPINSMPQAPQNTITLTSQSGTKFTFYDKDQLQVTFIGEWTPADFTFYVERYIDNEWQQFSDSNDYYELYGYENPYYIFWNNLNYYPAGTYRYSALLGNNPEQAYYSNSFEIYDSIIENNATGTVDSNGDVNINIDTGKTVDDIKDFMGSEPNFDDVDITKEDIENALNINETVSPYANVVMLFVNGLTDALLSTGDSSNFVFKVHTWGQTFTVRPSDVIPQYGQGLQQFMRTMSVFVFGWIIIKWAQQISETLSVADFSKTLELVEEKYSDLL